MSKRISMNVTIVSVEPVYAMVSGGYARSDRIESTKHVMRDELGRKLVWYATGNRQLTHGGQITAEVASDLYQSTHTDPYILIKNVRPFGLVDPTPCVYIATTDVQVIVTAVSVMVVKREHFHAGASITVLLRD